MTPLSPTTVPMYAVASGKGGVGKTSLTLNMAALLARQGHKVLLLDADTGLANLDVQLNLQPGKDLAHVVAGQATLAEVLLHIPQLTPEKIGPSNGGSVTLIPGRAGHAALANVPLPALTMLLEEVRSLATAEGFTVILIDVAAGIAPAQLIFCAVATATLLVVSPDPSSLTDAYALIKLLWQQNGIANTRLIINMASAREADEVHTRLNAAATGFLKLAPLPMLGHIPLCRQFSSAVRLHKLAAIAYPDAPSVAAIAAITKQL